LIRRDNRPNIALLNPAKIDRDDDPLVGNRRQSNMIEMVETPRAMFISISKSSIIADRLNAETETTKPTNPVMKRAPKWKLKTAAVANAAITGATNTSHRPLIKRFSMGRR